MQRYRVALDRRRDDTPPSVRQSAALRSLPQRLTPQAVTALSRTAGNRAVGRLMVQRCVYCGDWTCLKGEKCKRDPSFSGLLSPGVNPRTVGPHKETKKSSKSMTFESEHMVPSAAWKQSGLPHKYAELPTMSIPYEVHRGAVSGGGGGVTSTGSGNVAQGWSSQLGALMKSGNVKEAIRQAANDAYNAAWSQGRLTEAVVSQIMQVVNLHATYGDITQDEAGEINGLLMNRWLNHTGQF
jgi:hypothetical protein